MRGRHPTALGRKFITAFREPQEADSPNSSPDAETERNSSCVNAKPWSLAEALRMAQRGRLSPGPSTWWAGPGAVLPAGTRACGPPPSKLPRPPPLSSKSPKIPLLLPNPTQFSSRFDSIGVSPRNPPALEGCPCPVRRRLAGAFASGCVAAGDSVSPQLNGEAPWGGPPGCVWSGPHRAIQTASGPSRPWGQRCPRPPDCRFSGL